MNDRTVVAGGAVTALLLAGLAAVVTTPETVLAATPLGVAIYLGVGLALPQFALARRHGSDRHLRVALLAMAGAALALVAGVLLGGVVAPWGFGFVGVLAAVVVGVLVATAVRAFGAGYRAGMD